MALQGDLHTVGIGTADPASRLRAEFMVPQAIKVDLATTIVPVHVVNPAGSGAGTRSASGGVPWVAGRETAVPAAGYRAYVGIYNQSADRVLHIKRVQVHVNNSFIHFYTRSTKLPDSIRSGNFGVSYVDSAQQLAGLVPAGQLHYGDDNVFALGASDPKAYCPNVNEPIWLYPDAWLDPGYAFYVIVANAVLALQMATFEGEDFDL